jgi:hypothetical protein
MDRFQELEQRVVALENEDYLRVDIDVETPR